MKQCSSLQKIIFFIIILATYTVHADLNITAQVFNKIEQKYGVEAVVRTKQWQLLIEMSHDLPVKEKLRQVNDFFNKNTQFIDDIYLWGVKDYWATPLEFIVKGAGDCEDFSIAKYFTLKALGVSEKKMRMMYVKSLTLNQAHMVLTYFSEPRAIPIVLDNINPQLKLATERRDLIPVYSFNALNLWSEKSKGQPKKLGDASRLNAWAALQNKMLNNKI